MDESAVTLRKFGLEPMMVESTVKRQREMGTPGKKDAVRKTLEVDRAALLAAMNASAGRKS